MKTIITALLLLLAGQLMAQKVLVAEHLKNGKKKIIRLDDKIKLFYKVPDTVTLGKVKLKAGLRVVEDNHTDYKRATLLQILDDTAIQVVEYSDTVIVKMEDIVAIRKHPKPGRGLVRLVYIGGFITAAVVVPAGIVVTNVIAAVVVQEALWGLVDDKIIYPNHKIRGKRKKWKLYITDASDVGGS
ncbi:hypothetical protein R9C00_06455 [Flammeovirgaceae bacterium SG7u.111]|nr:hypothetical protein [Flammeovirgaceae bacterium SG7u.132]WPO37083.1 hypothetical protein R9C00_06455 [Flammeovirgaceae bacterium SG7u.111]